MLWMALLVALFGGCTRSTRPSFDGGAASPEALIDDYLAALKSKDRVALNKLMVTESEYVSIILPGTVPPRATPNEMPMKKRQYFWGANFSRSEYALTSQLASLGGRTLKLNKIEFAKPPEEFALYRVRRDPLLHLEAEDGRDLELHLGSIAEVGGRHKFLSFFAD